MELKIPDAEQAYWGLRAMKTVAMADGALNDSERYLLTSVQRIFGTTHELDHLAPITPAELGLEPMVRHMPIYRHNIIRQSSRCVG